MPSGSPEAASSRRNAAAASELPPPSPAPCGTFFERWKWPVGADDRAVQEDAILALMEASGADYLVLARYMQVLGPRLVEALAGRCINIHHSFLPGFKGAQPYHRAHARGVKLIGATAHFVTGDLDEGPIIEQDVERVDHSMDAETLSAIGRDVECVVLARAVKWFVEHRILQNGDKTVVFK